MPDEPDLAERLEELRRTPLGAITSEQARAAVEHILERERERMTVDVARFASAL